jgi:acetyltransferase-like isoleucine patch superfamily enzyme
MLKIKKYLSLVFSKIFWQQIKQGIALFFTDNIWGIKHLAYCGKNVSIRPSAILAYPHNIFLGNHVEIGRYAYLMAGRKSKIIIGDNTLIGPGAFITAGNHGIRRGQLIRLQKADEYDVMIGSDVFIGAHAIILPGAKIGDGAIIGAGTVIRRQVPAYAVMAGNPAKRFGSRPYK